MPPSPPAESLAQLIATSARMITTAAGEALADLAAQLDTARAVAVLLAIEARRRQKAPEVWSWTAAEAEAALDSVHGIEWHPGPDGGLVVTLQNKPPENEEEA